MDINFNFKMVKAMFEYTITGVAGLYASIISSIALDVPAPVPVIHNYNITGDNIVNIVTQLVILAGTITGFIIKYKELRKIKKEKKENENK